MVLALLGISLFTFSQVKHELIRRIAVFPLAIDKAYEKPGEESWWRVRHRLTEDQRFLVASRSFMIQRDVFQSRRELTPADAIILGKILDAHAVVTMYFSENKIYMFAYDARNSLLLWKNSIELNRNRPIADQIVPTTERLINDFIATVPYQGFQVASENRLAFREKDMKFVFIKTTTESQLEPGDRIEWLEIFGDMSNPVFTGEKQREVVAIGRVENTVGEIVKIQVLREKRADALFEGALVRVPKKSNHLQKRYSLSGHKNLSTDFFLAEIHEKKKEEDDASLVTALTFIANLAAFIVFAF